MAIAEQVRTRLLQCIVAVWLCFLALASGAFAAESPDQRFKVLAEFNHGAAMMEQYRYSEALKAFENVLKTAPDWTAARFNLGIAYFNMQGQRGAMANLEKSRDILQGILATQPDHLHARFCLGLYYQHVGDNEEAVKHFELAYRGDGHDPFVVYKYAESLIALQRHDEGTEMLEKVVALDPGFTSAIYRLAIQLRRLKRTPEAMPLFDRFRKLHASELTGGSFTVGKVYGMAGKYYMALGADGLPLLASQRLPQPRIVFLPETKVLPVETQSWKHAGGYVGLPGMAVGDVDGDGDLDLCLTGVDQEGGVSLWKNDGRGTFSQTARIAESGISPCFGDTDNDGDLDLWLGRAGADLLLENDGQGNFTAPTTQGIGGDAVATVCARLLDADSDGDLDLLAMRLGRGSVPRTAADGNSPLLPAPSSLYSNNRDGSFRDIATELELSMADTPIAAVVYDDFDNDRDLDLILFPAGKAQPIAWVNDRVGAFHTLDAETTGLDLTGAISATSGDPNNDGHRDLLVFTDEGVSLYEGESAFRFKKKEAFIDRCGSVGGSGGQFADIDNDGDLDIVIADARRPGGKRGPALLVNVRGDFFDAGKTDPGLLLEAISFEGHASCVVADFTGNGLCDILLAPVGKAPRLIENVTHGGHWIALDLRGVRPEDKKARSNNSAIGARVEVKTGNVFQQFVVGVPSGPVAMPPLRIHAGLGKNTKVDWLRILWPDAVLQAELELPADQRTTITELPRKTSSCPHLFAWNGSRFEFIADFGGMGGLGYYVGSGAYAMPDPTEYLAIPRLEPIGGEYVLQILEPLEEVVYFDEAKLIAVDHPIGTEVAPHEMMAVSADPPPFEMFCYRETIDPIKAVDHHGRDVTDRVLRVDRNYAGTTKPHEQFLGLAEDHFVDLDFGSRLDEFDATDGNRMILFLQGWVEYGYSSTNYAASQAGLRAKAPSIEVMRNGRWVTLFQEAGYPAGLNHTMTLDLTGKLLPGDRRLRISSNMEIYWDRVFIAEHSGANQLTLREVAADTADLHFLGYPREYSPDGKHPNLLDYANIDRAVAWKLMTGSYTRFGEVRELLDEADDCFVIMGRGEEVTLRFAADAFGPIPKGKHRTFVLKTDSYCKDMDLYTAHGETVEPLPFHAMRAYPYGDDQRYPVTRETQEYLRRYNTRRILGQ